MTTQESQRDHLTNDTEDDTDLKGIGQETFRHIVEGSIISTVLLQSERIVFANQAVCELSGYPKDELLAMYREDIQNIVHPDDREEVLKHMKARLRGDDAPPYQEFRFIRKDGSVRWVRTTARLLGQEGKPTIQVTYQDITELKSAETEKATLEAHYREIFDEAGEMISLLDIESMEYVHINAAIFRATGYTLKEMNELGIEGFTPKSEQFTKKKSGDYIKKAISGESQKFEWAFVDKVGVIHPTEVLLKRIRIADKEFLLSISHDVSDVKLADEALRESENRLHKLTDAAFEAIVIHENGILLEANDQFFTMFGYAKEELLQKQVMPLIVAPESQKVMRKKIDKGELGPYESIGVRKGGAKFPMEIRVRESEYLGRPVRVGALRDLSERKQAEEEHKRLIDLIEHSREFVGIATLDGSVLYVNSSGLDMVGLESLEDAQAKGIFEFVSEEMRTRLEGEIMPALFANGFASGEGTLLDFRTGKDIDVDFNLFLTTSPTTWEPRNIAITMRDITERKRSRDLLEASLKEKIVLLKEIHHRVKNNLQIISSLLDLQTYTIENEEIKKVFQESQNRIKSMALIHETLYRSEDFGHISVNDYIRTLLKHAEDSYYFLMHDLDMVVETDDISLNLDTAIPCGLLINELVSNAIKYAFPDEFTEGRSEPNRITIELHKQEDGKFQLRVADNGIGLPTEIDPKHAETLGLQLVGMLTEQLHGDILINRTHGTEFTITFSIRNPS